MEVGDIYWKGDIKFIAEKQANKFGGTCHGCGLHEYSTCEGYSCYDSDVDCGDLILKEIEEKVIEKEVEEEVIEKEVESPLDIQIGGSHYSKGNIQPIEFSEKNRLSFSAGNVVKYITRYKNKNGLEDLKKVAHYIDFIREFKHYSDKSRVKLEINVFDYIASNKLNFFEGKIIEAISLHAVSKEVRYLDVAKQCLEKLIKTEYGETD